jgi:hypothetical protein
VAYNFKTRRNKIQLLAEYENVTQKVLLFVEAALQYVKQFNMRAFQGT